MLTEVDDALRILSEKLHEAVSSLPDVGRYGGSDDNERFHNAIRRIEATQERFLAQVQIVAFLQQNIMHIPIRLTDDDNENITTIEDEAEFLSDSSGV